MMSSPTVRKLLPLFLGLVVGPVAFAQIGQPTEEEATLSPYDIPGGGGFKSQGLSKEPGLADPHDFTGTWNREGNPERFLSIRSGLPENRKNTNTESFSPGGPRSAGGSGGLPPGAGGAPGGGGPTSDSRMECIPTAGPKGGGDGPVVIIQTEDQLTWMAEEMHEIRRVFLTGGFTPDLEPSINGESIGHFEGDTLVVETRGMKSLPEGVRMIEHVSKSEQGRLLTDEISYLDAEGKAYGNTRTLTLFYRPNEQILEWICEDYGEAYEPGVYKGFTN